MSSLRQSLAVRMVLSVTLLVVTMVGFVASLWAVFVAILLFFDVPSAIARPIAGIPTAGLLLAIGLMEWHGSKTIERAAGGTPVSVEEYPELHATTNRVASMLDVPTPTVAVSDSPAPEAMVVGVRPSKTRLVLSTGTLDALDADELEAVIAHELAHVKNRDAAVMTFLSVPVVLTTGLVLRSPDVARHSGYLAIVLVIVGFAGAFVTRSIVAVCSRTRELAADRAAAEVLGSGAPLASALRTLDHRIRETPMEDLRTARSVSVLSILPFESIDEDEAPLTAWEGADVEPFLWSVRAPIRRLRTRLFRTHPPTETRLEMLTERERRQ